MDLKDAFAEVKRLWPERTVNVRREFWHWAVGDEEEIWTISIRYGTRFEVSKAPTFELAIEAMKKLLGEE